MKKIIIGQHEFEVVKKIPYGHVVWNVPMNDGYLLLCSLLNIEGIGMYGVDTNTLRAIKLEQSKIDIIKKAAIEGLGSANKIKKYIKRNEHSSNPYTLSKVEKGKKALEILETLM
ncbi:MAG: hypothetical protein ACLRVU_01195 [Beduini sp.]|uniref:hypothetical protein n=1 Tax=Beduini sp. TaxID=1922300 RepID=UPI0039A3C322